MEKNITFPTDSKTRYKAIVHLNKLAKEYDIPLRQTYLRIGKKRLRQAGMYRHARKMNKAKKEEGKIKTYLGRLLRDIQRKISGNDYLKEVFKGTLEVIERLLEQTKDSKDKIYSLHEPHVECISKGKFHKKYEFGCKVSLVITHKEGLALGSLAMHGKPYDGNTLKKALENSENNTGTQIERVYCDKGYRGHKVSDKEVFVPGQRKNLTKWFKSQLKRRQAIEPHIGHMKFDGKLGRNYLKGKIGDHLNAALCGIGHNLRLILRQFSPRSLAPA